VQSAVSAPNRLVVGKANPDEINNEVTPCKVIKKITSILHYILQGIKSG
jgi:hypothetical protein